jgi:hypothetical protein
MKLPRNLSQLGVENFSALSLTTFVAPFHTNQLNHSKFVMHVQLAHFHFESVDASVSCGIMNDDLVGFSSSIPQQRLLLDAIQSLVLARTQRHSDVQLSVDVGMPGQIQHRVCWSVP